MWSFKKHKSKALEFGFTLMELLIVIGIIGVLSSIVLTSLNSARSGTRDARRIMDFEQFSLALTLFHDKYGKYPCGDGSSPSGAHWDGTGSCPFLDGNAGSVASYGCAATHPNNELCVDAPTFGLKTEGLFSISDFLTYPY